MFLTRIMLLCQRENFLTVEVRFQAVLKGSFKMKEKSRYEKIKELDISEMVVFLSWYFDCFRCPAKRDNCSDNNAMCVDALEYWIEQEGQL